MSNISTSHYKFITHNGAYVSRKLPIFCTFGWSLHQNLYCAIESFAFHCHATDVSSASHPILILILRYELETEFAIKSEMTFRHIHWIDHPGLKENTCQLSYIPSYPHIQQWWNHGFNIEKWSLGYGTSGHDTLPIL